MYIIHYGLIPHYDIMERMNRQANKQTPYLGLWASVSVCVIMVKDIAKIFDSVLLITVRIQLVCMPDKVDIIHGHNEGFGVDLL